MNQTTANNTGTATANYIVSFPPSKKDILFRLFNAGHITFDELWALAQDTVVNNYIPQPNYPISPSYPITYGGAPITLTDESSRH